MAVTFDIWRQVMDTDLAFWEMADGKETNYRSLFTATATIAIGTVRINGIEDIETFMENRKKGQPNLLSRHICSNHRLKWISDGVIEGTGIVSVHAGEGRAPIKNNGPYLVSDVTGYFELTAGIWKIASRNIIPVFTL